MAQATYVFVARVQKVEVAGEVAETHLVLYRDTDVVQIEEGDEFVTVGMMVDPFKDEH